MEDDKTLNSEPETEEEIDDGVEDDLAAKIAEIKGKTEDETPVKEPTKETAVEEKPAIEEPTKPPLSDEEFEAQVNAKVQERIDAAVRDASQKAADAVVARERAKEDSARKALRDYELKAGKKLDQLIAEVTGQQVQALVDQGYDEQQARDHVTAQARVRELEAKEQERQFEHQVQTLRNAFAQDKLRYLSAAEVDDDDKALIRRYDAEISAFAEGQLSQGQPMDFEVALTYFIGLKRKEWRTDQKAALDKAKETAEQRTLKNVQERGKAKVESGGVAAKTDALPSLNTDQKDMAHAAMPHLPKAEAERRYAARLKQFQSRK